jgi:hypothetical protein
MKKFDKDSIICEDLPYEIDMLRYAYQRLQSSPPETPEYNALIECFSVHARDLLDFFWDPTPKKGNHAIARHFLANTCSYNPFDGVDNVSSPSSPQGTTTPNISITATGTIGQKSP